MKKIASKTHHRGSPSAEIRVLDASSKDKIFRSAEALFSTKGFREVSVRDIAARAGVHFALVAYYFGGKQALLDEIFHSHVAPLVEDGMKRLKAITKGGRKPSVEEILKAWILPCLRQGEPEEGRMIHLRIIASLSHERWEYTKKVSSYMQRSYRAFIKALQSCLPHLSKETLMWRLHFVMGALFFGIRQPASLIALSGARCNPEDLEATFDQILPYAAAGFRAAECAGAKSRKSKK
ncbi:MAG: TetR family transcriptional regulator [Acidobacteria bacterium]|nr:TetR family transcriptional regulator [Acidobacteriota bacterium]